MEQKEKTPTEELIELVKNLTKGFIDWLKPDQGEHLILKIIKIILKIPITLFIILVSPVLLLLLGIIFVLLL